MFSTAHKAKGLEFDTVRLAEDFLPDVSVHQISKLFVVPIYGLCKWSVQMARLTKGICFSITEDEPDDEKNLLAHDAL